MHDLKYNSSKYLFNNADLVLINKDEFVEVEAEAEVVAEAPAAVDATKG